MEDRDGVAHPLRLFLQRLRCGCGFFHQCSVLLGNTLCRINVPALRALASNLPSLHNNILRLLSTEVQRDHRMLSTLGVMSAEERLICFLLDLSVRLSARGFASSEFRLRMTREEIGRYLGLQLETVSRLFSRLSDAGLIEIRHRSVKLLDATALHAIYARTIAEAPAER
ncbi:MULTISPECIES: helix-turn-helix domain-containing protein [unclassified Cupriavidus]|uniref:helix-turn-helix domain-containing protein n=1 Tax=unclassified Cupriavidus TaxID=2640874 RepID=UPI003F930D5C